VCLLQLLQAMKAEQFAAQRTQGRGKGQLAQALQGLIKQRRKGPARRP
jgi:hypothetical protein